MSEWWNRIFRSDSFHEPKSEQESKPVPFDDAAKHNALHALCRTLRSMEQAEATRQLLKQLKRFEATSRPALAIVVDTSFLMLDNLPSTFTLLRTLARDNVLRVDIHVPVEIENEIHSHFERKGNAPEQFQRATVARKRLADLVEKGATNRITLETAEEHVSESIIGADSPVDRKLIGTAKQLISSGDVCGVFVATDDGGIMLDVAHLSRQGISISTLTKEKSEDEIIECTWRWLACTSDEFLRLIAGAGRTN